MARRIIEQPSPKERAEAELREIEARMSAQQEEAAKDAAEERVSPSAAPQAV